MRSYLSGLPQGSLQLTLSGSRKDYSGPWLGGGDGGFLLGTSVCRARAAGHLGGRRAASQVEQLPIV